MKTIEGFVKFAQLYNYAPPNTQIQKFPSNLVVLLTGTIGSDGEPAEFRIGLNPEAAYQLKRLIEEWE